MPVDTNVLKQDENIILLPENVTVDILSQTILSLKNNPDFRNTLRNNAAAFYHHYLSWETITKKYYSIFHMYLNNVENG